jgi:trans-aconitate methyltransferase
MDNDNILKKGYVAPALLETLADLLEKAKKRTYSALNLTLNSRVLDVGGGPGTDTIPIAERLGAEGEVVGVDSDPEMIEKAKQRIVSSTINGKIRHVCRRRFPITDNLLVDINSLTTEGFHNSNMSERISALAQLESLVSDNPWDLAHKAKESIEEVTFAEPNLDNVFVLSGSPHLVPVR